MPSELLVMQGHLHLDIHRVMRVTHETQHHSHNRTWRFTNFASMLLVTGLLMAGSGRNINISIVVAVVPIFACIISQ